jgi:hypothetical protein
MLCSDGVDLAPTQLFGEPHERETWEREVEHVEERKGELLQKNSLNPNCMVSSSQLRGGFI